MDNNSNVTYAIFKDGYDIYLNGSLWFTQREPYIPDKTKTYEENAVLQIQELLNPPEDDIIPMDDVYTMLVDYEYRLTLIELGV